MDLEEIKKFLKENKDAKAKLTEELVTPDLLGKMAKERHKAIESILDKNADKAIKSFKENGMKNILEKSKGEFFDEFAEEHGIVTDPALKSMQKKMKELEEKNRNIEIANRTEQAKRKAVKNLSDRGLPTDVVDLIDFSKAADDDGYLDEVTDLIDSTVTATVKKRLSENKHPASGDEDYESNNPFSKKTFNLTKQVELYRDDPGKAKELKKQAEKE